MEILAILHLVLLLAVTSGASGNSLVDSCIQPYTRQCMKIALMEGNPNAHQLAILQELCKAGYGHITKATLYPRDQFAVMNIHKDKSTDYVQWNGGKCPNVVCQEGWSVDELASLRPGLKGSGKGSYHWYLNGLPMWPLPDQCLNKDSSTWALRQSRGKEPKHSSSRWPTVNQCLSLNCFSLRLKSKWPNYAVATPPYHLQDECKITRNPGLAVRKLFRNFSKPSKFRNFVESFMENFLDKKGNQCIESFISDLEEYNRWLQPFVMESLHPMVKYAKLIEGKCPAELYIFIRNEPKTCFLAQFKKDLNHIRQLLNCMSMSIIIGSKDL